jgi:hypothetical protein
MRILAPCLFNHRLDQVGADVGTVPSPGQQGHVCLVTDALDLSRMGAGKTVNRPDHGRGRIQVKVKRGVYGAHGVPAGVDTAIGIAPQELEVSPG